MRASSGVISDRMRANAGWVSSTVWTSLARRIRLRPRALQIGDASGCRRDARRGRPSGRSVSRHARARARPRPAGPTRRPAGSRRRLAVHRAARDVVVPATPAFTDHATRRATRTSPRTAPRPERPSAGRSRIGVADDARPCAGPRRERSDRRAGPARHCPRRGRLTLRRSPGAGTRRTGRAHRRGRTAATRPA